MVKRCLLAVRDLQLTQWLVLSHPTFLGAARPRPDSAYIYHVLYRKGYRSRYRDIVISLATLSEFTSCGAQVQ